MHKARVLTQSDGSLLIIHPAYADRSRQGTGTTDDEWFGICLAKTLAKHPDWAALPGETVALADLPADRSKRHAWRLKNGRVAVDPSVPDKPHPKQALLDEIEAANSIGQLKAALRKALGG